MYHVFAQCLAGSGRRASQGRQAFHRLTSCDITWSLGLVVGRATAPGLVRGASAHLLPTC